MPAFVPPDTLNERQLEALRQALLQRLGGPNAEPPVVVYELRLSESAHRELANVQARLQRIETLMATDWDASLETMHQRFRKTLVAVKNDWNALDKHILNAQESRAASLITPVQLVEERWRQLEKSTISSSLQAVEEIRKSLGLIEKSGEAMARTLRSLSTDDVLNRVNAAATQFSAKADAARPLEESVNTRVPIENTPRSFVLRYWLPFMQVTTFLVATLSLFYLLSSDHSRRTLTSTPAQTPATASPVETRAVDVAKKDSVSPQLPSVPANNIASPPQPVAPAHSRIAQLCGVEDNVNASMCDVLRRNGDKICKSMADRNDKKSCAEFVRSLHPTVPGSVKQNGTK